MKERVAEAPYGAYNSPHFVGLESSFMPCRFEIGPWVLDTESNTVCRDGRVIRLEPKVVEVCACLGDRAGEVVRKEELIGPWVLDTESNTVCRDGRVIRLEPKVVEVCACLADRAGEVVRKEELIGAVWPNTFVTDDVLSHAISELRKAFEDDARQPCFIETIPKRGYRMIAPVVAKSGVASVPGATQAGAVGSSVGDVRRGSASGRWVRGVAVMMTVAVAAGIAIWVQKSHPALPSDTTVLI